MREDIREARWYSLGKRVYDPAERERQIEQGRKLSEGELAGLWSYKQLRDMDAEEDLSPCDVTRAHRDLIKTRRDPLRRSDDVRAVASSLGLTNNPVWGENVDESVVGAMLSKGYFDYGGAPKNNMDFEERSAAALRERNNYLAYLMLYQSLRNDALNQIPDPVDDRVAAVDARLDPMLAHFRAPKDQQAHADDPQTAHAVETLSRQVPRVYRVLERGIRERYGEKSMEYERMRELMQPTLQNLKKQK